MAQIFVHRRHLSGIIRRKRCGVRLDHAVPQADDAGSILLCKLRVMGDHDHKAVFGHLLQQLHHLNAGVAVQCAGRLVGQQDVGVVDQCAGNGHTLHLAAGHFAGVLVQLVAQTYLLQRLGGPAAALGTGNAGDGQRQLHIGKHCLVRDEVIALEHKANGVVAVRVPVAVGIFFGGDAVDDQITAVVAVQTANDVQQGGLTGTAGAENGDEFVVPQVQADIIQCFLHQIAGFVFFLDVVELEHV